MQAQSTLRFQVSVHGGDRSHVGPLAITFEAARAALESLPRMFIEPDGSFVWTGISSDAKPWQVDGNLIDRGDVLAYVELKGACKEAQFETLLTALRGTSETLCFQLPQRGIFLDKVEFRRLAMTDTGAI
jgi:hypothetical protein